MAWNDPFETLVDGIVGDLVAYLEARGDRAPHEIARTSEICRDFCQFLCKDVHKASKQDYTIYMHLHALTANDEAEYQVMLGDIQSFCAQSGSFQDSVAQQGVKSSRREVITNSMKERPEFMDFLLTNAHHPPTVKSYKSPSSSGVSESHRVLNADTSFRASGLIDAAAMRRASDPVVSATKSVTPARSVQSVPSVQDVLSASLSDQTLAPSKVSQRSSISQRFNQFDFNIDSELARNVGNENTVNPRLLERVDSKNRFGNSNPNFSDCFPAVDDSGVQSSLELDNSVAKQVAQNDFSKALLDKDASLQNNELLRGVNGIDYHFTQAGLEQVRLVDREQMVSEPASPAIDKNLIQGFRPFVFDGKYRIDMPLPDASRCVPNAPHFVARFLFPLSPTLFFVAATVFGMSLNPLVGAILAIFAILSFVLVFPDIRPMPQQTPQATLNAYLSARSSRCVAVAQTLIAHSGEDVESFDLPALWADEAPSWPVAILNRFRNQVVENTRIVLGSEGQNAVVLLVIHPDDVNAYALAPLVRIRGLWFLTDPTLTKRFLSA